MAIDPTQIEEWKRLVRLNTSSNGRLDNPSGCSESDLEDYGDLARAVPVLLAEVERLTEELRLARAAGMPTWPPTRSP